MRPMFHSRFYRVSMFQKRSELNITRPFGHNSSAGEESYLEDPVFQAFRTYFLPAFVLLGLCVNSLVLFGMARARRGFSESTRLYYATMAAAQLVVVIAVFFIGQFIESTLYFWSGQRKLFRTINAVDWSCKLFSAVWVGADGVASYSLVCLGVERSLAVTWPLRAKSLLTTRFSVTLLCTVNCVYVLY